MTRVCTCTSCWHVLLVSVAD